jgi:hypothetical protein
MVAGGHVQAAFDLTSEADATRELYGRNGIGEKAILARRLVESGVAFVVVSGAWGYFDHHGDSVQWGGIVKGLTPLLPQVDRALFGLITDLERRGLLDSTLVLMMGEFGRAPVINKDAGRDLDQCHVDGRGWRWAPAWTGNRQYRLQRVRYQRWPRETAGSGGYRVSPFWNRSGNALDQSARASDPNRR